MSRFAGILLVGALLAGLVATPAMGGTADTTIDLWYGERQSFGDPGVPQQFANVLGNVSDPDGMASLAYRLNGGAAQALTIGPDKKRLANKGDFNVDIDFAHLDPGENTVELIARDKAGNETRKVVRVDYVAGRTWPLPYSVDWGSVGSIPSAAQVVDGKWRIDGGMARTVEPGYDRLLDIGDITWDDYEVLVPVRVNGGMNGEAPRRGAGVGVLMRWTGHTDSGTQPDWGYLPHGCIGWLKWLSGGERLALCDGNAGSATSFPVTIGTTYLFRMRVETTVDTFRYSIRVWPEGSVEPAAWALTVDRPLDAHPRGSLLLVAQKLDASFGDLTVTPVTSEAPTKVATPTISPNGGTFEGSVEVSLASTTEGSEIRYTLDGSTPTASSPLYSGPFVLTQSAMVKAQAFKDGLDASAVASASFTISEAPTSAATPTITPDGGTFSGSAEVSLATATDGAEIRYTIDGSAPSSSSPLYAGPFVLTESATVKAQAFKDRLDPSGVASASFTISEPPSGTSPVSDDFSGSTLDSRWTYIDPKGDGTAAMTGTQLALSVPEGSSHDVWSSGNFAPRVVQRVADADLSLEVKFDSGVDRKYQMQGLIIDGGGGNFLRLEFHSDGSRTRYYAASFSAGQPKARLSGRAADNGVPLSMRIHRVGDTWTMEYSANGTTWSTAGSFTEPLVPLEAGVFVANCGSPECATGAPAPAHTALVDHFENLAAPLTGKD